MPHPIAEAMRGVKRAILNTRGNSNVFRDIYLNNRWDGTESVSGPGSTMEATEGIRVTLPRLISELNVLTLLDLPCGDVHWISRCLPPSIRYLGGDVVPDIIERNRKALPELGTFQVIDLATDPLPEADLILVRDCFIHLPNRMILKSIANIRSAKIRYFLSTTFPNESTNQDIEIGGYRPINLVAPPFGLPAPERYVLDEEGSSQSGKHLGLWKMC